MKSSKIFPKTGPVFGEFTPTVSFIRPHLSHLKITPIYLIRTLKKRSKAVFVVLLFFKFSELWKCKKGDFKLCELLAAERRSSNQLSGM